MNFEPQMIPGVYLIKPTPFVDGRGVFRRHFCAREFADHGLASAVEQANVSENARALTLRGFHYQRSPHGEGKTLSCLQGRVHDIVVDLRADSPTFKKWLSFVLDAETRNSLHVPPGCANAFLTLADNCLVHYYCSHSYAPAAEEGIRYDDPAFGFVWPTEPIYVSEKDRSHPDFRS